ncbi:MAG: MMPL family transporter, partial [Parasporobacterium sp.]|nr:MMPL family transporter [Parasporobacterium sp.]
MVNVGKWIAKHRLLIFLVSLLLLVPSVFGMIKTRVNYDLLTYLPESLDTVKGQQTMVDEFGMGAFSMIVVENTDRKDVARLEEKLEEIPHVKDVLWYDDAADITLPVEMIPERLRNAFFSGDATMLVALLDTSTSSDEALKAVTDISSTVNESCFVSGMTSVINDVKNLSDHEVPIYVVIAVTLSLIILQLMSDSFLIPLIYLAGIGIAILYNMGTNVFLGETSYITKA